jgi:DNA-binding transcriptional LysR family regulator
MLHSRLLRYLDEVSRLGSIRKAAARLNVASSAINRQILALENELGAPIFERMPRRLRLTATGEVLIAHVRDTLKGHQRAEAQIEALKGLARGEVTIATMNGLAAGPLPRFLSSILDQHPRVHLRVRVLPFDQMTNAVLTGEADLALTYNPPNSPGLRIVASHDLAIGAVVSPKHPLTAFGRLRRVSTRGCRFFHDDPSRHRSRLYPRQHSATPDNRDQFDRIHEADCPQWPSYYLPQSGRCRGGR